ncbi:MAG: cyclic nucleotide-binding domain-containing protein, partial [Clostridia bacterium]|nr:cyclic nucleotide-binding domain-containing protein [Clostridia bacterium]
MECISFLQNTRPFISLPKVTIIQICSRLELKKYPQDSFVFKKGELSHNMLYIVFKGLAEVIVSTENQDIGVSYRKPGDFFGETVFLSGDTYPASVKAVEDLYCFSLDKETFEDLCIKHPCFAKHFSH